MDIIKKQLFEFRKLYREWFKSLSTHFEDDKKPIIQYYRAHMDDTHESILKEFLGQMKPHLELLSKDYKTFFEVESNQSFSFRSNAWRLDCCPTE